MGQWRGFRCYDCQDDIVGFEVVGEGEVWGFDGGKEIRKTEDGLFGKCLCEKVVGK